MSENPQTNTQGQALDTSLLHLSIGFGITLVAIYLLSPIIPALIIAFLLYVILEPFAAKLWQKGFSRTQAAGAILLTIIITLALTATFGSSAIIDQVQSVYEQINSIKAQISSQLDIWNNKLIDKGLDIDLSGLKDMLASSALNIDNEFLAFGSSLIASIASYLLLVPLILFFLLKDYRSIRNKTLGFLPNRFFELGWLIYYRVSTQLHRYFRGVMLQVLILSTVATIGFYLIGFESFLVFGILAGLLVVIPYLGLILAIAIPVLVSWSSNPGDYLMLANIVLVVALAYLNDQIFVIPTVIASAVDLHPMIIIIGIVLFGFYLGILGMVVAVPVLATIKIVLESLMNGLQQRVEAH